MWSLPDAEQPASHSSSSSLTPSLLLLSSSGFYIREEKKVWWVFTLISLRLVHGAVWFTPPVKNLNPLKAQHLFLALKGEKDPKYKHEIHRSRTDTWMPIYLFYQHLCTVWPYVKLRKSHRWTDMNLYCVYLRYIHILYICLHKNMWISGHQYRKNGLSSFWHIISVTWMTIVQFQVFIHPFVHSLPLLSNKLFTLSRHTLSSLTNH